jgi:hypothetical protein
MAHSRLKRGLSIRDDLGSVGSMKKGERGRPFREKALNTPIDLFRIKLSASTKASVESYRAEVERRVSEERHKKFLLLADEYAISAKSDTKEFWFEISQRLANRFLEGFEVIDTSVSGAPQVKKRGRPPGASTWIAQGGRSTVTVNLPLLFEAVNQVLDEEFTNGRKISVPGALKILTTRKGPWKRLKAGTLEPRYYEAKKRFVEFLERMIAWDASADDSLAPGYVKAAETFKGSCKVYLSEIRDRDDRRRRHRA